VEAITKSRWKITPEHPKMCRKFAQEQEKKLPKFCHHKDPKLLGKKYTSRGRIRTLPSKTARILYHLATQRHRNKITAEWKQPPLLRMEHQTMVQKLVKKKKRAKEGCEKKPPN